MLTRGFGKHHNSSNDFRQSRVAPLCFYVRFQSSTLELLYPSFTLVVENLTGSLYGLGYHWLWSPALCDEDVEMPELFAIGHAKPFKATIP